jgi:hypothetical protein
LESGFFIDKGTATIYKGRRTGLGTPLSTAPRHGPERAMSARNHYLFERKETDDF